MDRTEQLRQQLETARGLVKAYFETDDCPWEQRFHQEQHACRHCADGFVCEWLFEHDTPPDLAAYTPAQLRNALVFAAGYLEGRMTQGDHKTGICPCATCSWVRQARDLVESP